MTASIDTSKLRQLLFHAVTHGANGLVKAAKELAESLPSAFDELDALRAENERLEGVTEERRARAKTAERAHTNLSEQYQMLCGENAQLKQQVDLSNQRIGELRDALVAACMSRPDREGELIRRQGLELWEKT